MSPTSRGSWACGRCGCSRCRRCARECDAREKDALNFLFVAIPLINVLIPIVWKSFPAVFTADCVLMAYMYYNKGAGIFDDGEEAVAVEGSED